MKLRTRLALAFLLMSVVPLTAITLYSYSSSLTAFRRAVEAEETAIAGDMGRQMDRIAAIVSERMDRVTAAAQDRNWRDADRQQQARFRQQVVETLGDTAGFVSSLSFVPAPPPTEPTGGQRGSHNIRGNRGPNASVPAPPSPSAPPPPPDVPSIATTVELIIPSVSRALEGIPKAPGVAGGLTDLEKLKSPDGLKSLENLKSLGTLGPEIAAQATEVSRKLEDSVAANAAAMQARARDIEQQARELERRGAEEQRRMADARLRAYQRWFARNRQGQPVDVPVRRDGQLVGTMNAHISLDRMLQSILSGRSRATGDIVFAIDPEKKLHTTGPKEQKTLESLGLLDRIRNSKQDSQTVATDDWVVVTRRDPSGVVFGIARPIGSALGEIRRATGRNLGLGMLAIFVALAGIAPLSRRMTRNLSVLHAGVEQIAQGDLTARVRVRSTDEIGNLADAFNQMAQDLEAHQKVIAERERLRGELELCRQIQNEMLPKEPLRLRFAEVKGVSIPAREVGGDFFNYFLLPEGEVGLLVGDVSGKGVGAALLMANVQATLRARLPVDRDLAHLAETIDWEVERNTPPSVYLTLFVGILDSAQRTLRYVNAGHNPQFVLRKAGGLERLPSTGLPVGMFAGHGYAQSVVQVDEGDILFFYTDGITEVENPAGDMFGSERLERLLVEHHQEGVDQLLARIEQAVADFRGAAEPFDDATMMILRLGDATAVSRASDCKSTG